MPVRQSCDGQLRQPRQPRRPCGPSQPFNAAATAPSRLAAGQLGMHDLRAGTSIVAVEGNLQLGFRDHSLAWLGDAVPLTRITLHEGERFVTPQRGVVLFKAVDACSVSFIVQDSSAENVVRRAFHQTVRHLAGLVKARLRRIA